MNLLPPAAIDFKSASTIATPTPKNMKNAKTESIAASKIPVMTKADSRQPARPTIPNAPPESFFPPATALLPATALIYAIDTKNV
jgi:hypothetical protein